jgi:hypothetical protein
VGLFWTTARSWTDNINSIVPVFMTARSPANTRIEIRAHRRRRKMAIPVEVPHALRTRQAPAMINNAGLKGRRDAVSPGRDRPENTTRAISPPNRSVAALPKIASTALTRIPVQF